LCSHKSLAPNVRRISLGDLQTPFQRGRAGAAIAARKKAAKKRKLSTWDYVKLIGMPQLLACENLFDPGYEPVSLESHPAQRSPTRSILRISMLRRQLVCAFPLTAPDLAVGLACAGCVLNPKSRRGRE
jgi:hypothetical protein